MTTTDNDLIDDQGNPSATEDGDRAPMTNFHRTSEWLRVANKTPGNVDQFSVQVGCHIEEFIEMLDTLQLTTTPSNGVRDPIHETLMTHQLASLIPHLTGIANDLKSGRYHAHVKDPVALIDSLCDQSVTGDGVAYIADFDKAGADTAVIDSNFDKLNPDGTPVIKDGGKIGKREGWKAPDLSQFVGARTENLLTQAALDAKKVSS